MYNPFFVLDRMESHPILDFWQQIIRWNKQITDTALDLNPAACLLLHINYI